MANIEQLTKDGNDIYPVTTPDAVRDENGVNLKQRLGEIGNLSSLQTTDKSNLVNAINEVAQGGGGSEWELVKTIVTDGTETNNCVSILDSLEDIAEVFIDRRAVANTNTSVYVQNENKTVQFKAYWLGSVAGYRNAWHIKVSSMITFCEGWYYNYANDTLRLSLREAGTSFGNDLTKGVYIRFYNIAAVPAGDTYYVYVKRK